MHRILIIEDDMVIAREVASHLTSWGYDARYVTEFHDIMAQFVEIQPQLVLMDVALPFMNGYHWCAEIRRMSEVPVVFISSASDSMNIVMAMNMGADDFIAKPFDLGVLSAKVGAMLRRAYSFGGQMHIIERGGALLNLSDASVSYGSEKRELTKNELRILQILMENAGRVASRDELMLRLWESDSFIDDNTLSVNVARLRRKLDDMGLADFVVTKKGLGYMVV